MRRPTTEVATVRSGVAGRRGGVATGPDRTTGGPMAGRTVGGTEVAVVGDGGMGRPGARPLGRGRRSRVGASRATKTSTMCRAAAVAS